MRRLAVIALFAAAPARGDDSPGERVPKLVSVHLDGTVARLVERVDLGSVGKGDNPGLEFQVPHLAVVTGATATIGGSTHKLALVKQDTMTAAMTAIMEAAPGADRTWAIGLVGEPRFGTVNAEIIAPQSAHAEVELALEMPTCFWRDTRYVELTSSLAAIGPAVTPLIVAKPQSIVEMCGGSAENTWLALPVHEAGAPKIAVVAQRLPLSATDFSRVELDLARELADIPADLHTAIVIDGSRSLSTDEAEAQRAVATAYLRAAPQSRVQVIAYARDAHALLPAWENATAASARVDREIRALVARNGSNVDAGLVAAGEWLARVPGTHRVIVFTDQRVADRLAKADAKALAQVLPAGTLVHVVAIESGDGEIEHDDSIAFGELAVATEGIGARGRAGVKGELDATILARPIALEKIAVHAPGWEAKSSLAGENCQLETVPTLERGRSCAWWGEGPAAAGPVTITGMLWNSPFTRIVRPDPAGARTLARRLVAVTGLADDVQHDIDLAAFVLDGAWAMLATWGGKGGYSDAEDIGRIGLGTIGTCGCDGGIGDFGHGTGTGVMPRLDLRAQLARAVAGCQPRGASVKIDLETTLQEIVDVGVTVDGPRALHDCIVDAVWDTFLAIPNAPEHAHTSFVI
jgi:hypothetical protein